MDPFYFIHNWGWHQDYGWFLALVAWGGACVGFASSRHWGRAAPWLVGFAALNLAVPVLEMVSFTWGHGYGAEAAEVRRAWRLAFDLGIGALYPLAAACLWQAIIAAAPRVAAGPRFGLGARSLAGFSVAAGLCLGRESQPVAVGAIAGLLGAVLVWLLIRRKLSLQHELDGFGRVGLVLWCLTWLVAPSGPLAHALGESRRLYEVGGSTGVAQLASFAAGACLVVTAWRRRLLEDQDAGRWATVCSALWLLLAWLVFGFCHLLWSAVQVRNDYEANLLQRARMLKISLDQDDIDVALGPAFQIGAIHERPRLHGGRLVYSRVDHAMHPSFERLRRQLAKGMMVNEDIWDVSLLVRRGDWLAVAIKWPDFPEFFTEIILTPPDPEWEALANQGSQGFIVGPRREPWGEMLHISVPLPGRSKAWLDIEVMLKGWAAAFAQARLQALEVVLFGVLLWGVGVRLRLRRMEQVRGEAQVRAAREADRAKGILLANVSHELRTPLQNILGYSELLEPEVTGAAGRARLDLVRQQVRLMSRLVNDLLDLSALESGTFRFAPEPTDLRRVVEAVVEAQRPRAEAKGLALQLVVDPALPAWLLVDPARLHQIATNLVGNAVKYTPGGRVEVVLLGLGGGRYELSVADTGPGIPAEEQRELFRPFSRLARPGHPEGSGLGLALSAALCRLAGGSIAIESDGRTGSRFRASFTAGTVAAPVAAPVQPAGSLAGRRVLVADDNPHVRELFAASLAQAGVQCDQVPDGGQAIARARAGNYDAAVIDLAMPVCNGFEVARRLRAEPPPGPRLRLVAVSAHAGNAEREQALAGGFDVFLVKPVEAAVLAAALAVPVATPPREVSAALRAAFAAELPGLAAELAGLVAAADWPALRARAHYTKSSAAVLGYDPLFDALGRLEDAAAAGDAAGVADAWAACAPRLRAGR